MTNVKKEPVKSDVQEAQREPSKRQRIEIFTLLAECYDIDLGRYQNGDTDETVAEVLGVLPGWVAQIREAEFGPDGGNEDIEALIKSLREAEHDLKAMLQIFENHLEGAKKKLADVSVMRANLEKIKKAVGPRNLRIAGVT